MDTALKRELALRLLACLKTKGDLERVLDEGLTEECFSFDPALRRAFAYIAQRVGAGRPVSHGDVASAFGVELPTDASDPVPYARRLAAAWFLDRLLGIVRDGMQRLDEDDPWEGYRQMRRDLDALVLPRRYRDEGLVHLEAVTEPEPRRWIVPDVIPEGWPVWIYGKGGHAKGYLAVLLALSVSEGIEFLGRPAKRMPVLYVDWEMDRDEFVRKLVEVWDGTIGRERGKVGQRGWERLYYRRCLGPLHLCFSDIQDAVREHGIGLVIIDSFGFAMSGSPNPRQGRDMNKAQDVLATVALLQQIPATVVVIDHESRMGSNVYGSVYKENVARWMWRVETRRGPGEERVLYQRLTNTKGNLDGLHARIYLRYEWEPVLAMTWERQYRVRIEEMPWDEMPEEWQEEEERETGRPDDRGDDRLLLVREMLEALRRDGSERVGLTAEDIAANLGMGRSGALKWLGQMVRRGRLGRYVERVGKRGRPVVYFTLPGDSDGDGLADVSDL